MIKPRLFALTVWEPSIGRANTHVHDKVEFYIVFQSKNGE